MGKMTASARSKHMADQRFTSPYHFFHVEWSIINLLWDLLHIGTFYMKHNTMLKRRLICWSAGRHWFKRKEGSWSKRRNRIFFNEVSEVFHLIADLLVSQESSGTGLDVVERGIKACSKVKGDDPTDRPSDISETAMVLPIWTCTLGSW